MKMKFVNKNLAEILAGHPEYKRILLKFYHGMGDAIMFYANCLPALERTFPNCEFFFETQLGQEEFFGDADPNEEHYDLAVFLNFPCAEWDEGPETKAEKCARVELGIEIGEDHPSRYRLPFFCLSPLVGFHFVSTSNDSICCPENFAYHLWEKTVACYLDTEDGEKLRRATDRMMAVGYVRFLYLVSALHLGGEELRAVRIRHAAGHLRKLLESVDGFTL